MVVGKKNEFMNFLKGLACFGVVFIHVKLPNFVSDGVIQSMFRFAIPLFFMVSGYFCDTSDRETLEKKLPGKWKHILKISIIGCVYYFVFHMLIAVFGDSGGSIEDIIWRIKLFFSPQKLLEWVIFNQDPFVNILWFTFALLYCYLILWVVNHFNWYRKVFWCIPLFLGAHIIMGNLLLLFGIELSKLYYRNFLFYGLPFMFLGIWLRRNRERVLEKVSVKTACVLMAAGTLLSPAEWFVFGRRELFIGSILFVLGGFAYALHKPEAKKNSPITVIGERYSLFIYIVHFSLISVLDRFAYKLIPTGLCVTVYEYVKVLIIFALSLMGAYILEQLMKKWKNRKENKVA